MSNLKAVPSSSSPEPPSAALNAAEEEARPSEKRPNALSRAELEAALRNLQARKQELANAFQQVVGAEVALSQLLALID
jgi:hypothetical protein